MKIVKYQITGSSEREHRLLFQHGPEGFYAQIKPEMKGEVAEFTELIKKTPEAQPVFDAMFDRGQDVTIDSLQDYIDGRVAEESERPLNSFETDLKERLEKRNNADDGKDKLHAERSLQSLVQYIAKYNKSKAASIQKRADFRQKEQLPVGIHTVTSTAKQTLSAHMEGFRNATAQDRAVMLAGVIVSVIVLKKIWDGIASQQTGAGAALKNLLGIGIGGGALWLAYEAANRNAKIVSKGRVDANRLGGLNAPLLSDDAMYEEELNRITDDLRKRGVPPAFIDSMLTVGGKKEKKFMAGVAALSALRVEEAKNLYDKYKDSGKHIPDEDWSFSPAIDKQKDKNKTLSPTERFALLEEMGTAMGLIKGGEFNLPDNPARQNKTMLYLITTGIDIK